MRKITKRAIVVLLTLLMVCALCACGKKGGDAEEGGDALKGTWTRHDEFYGDIELKMDGKGGCSIKYSAEGLSDDKGSYIINSDTDLSVKLNSWDDYQSCTYVVEGDKLTISDNYSVFEGEYTK